MTVKLPSAIATYFAGKNVHDVDSMLTAFTDTAIVKDEGQEFRGKAAIGAWMNEIYRKFRARVEALDCSETNGKATVIARVTGTFPKERFPGDKPVHLRYIVTFSGEKIAYLEIQVVSETQSPPPRQD